MFIDTPLRLPLILAAAALMIACQDVDSGDSEVPTAVTGPGIDEPIGTPGTLVNGPVEPRVPAGLTACAPSAHSPQQAIAADLYDWVVESQDGSCSLTGMSHEGESTSGTVDIDELDLLEPGELWCDHNGCWEQLPILTRSWTEPAPYDDTWAWQWPQHWMGVISARRSTETGALRIEMIANQQGSSANIRLERTYDDGGRLLEESYRFNDHTWFTLTQEWQDDRLVSAVFDDDINGTGLSATTWSYDASGRLAGAERVSDGRVDGLKWTYDEDGWPLTRSQLLDGEVVDYDAWTWQNSQLTEHISEATQSWLEPLDDRMPLNSYVFFQRNWDLHGYHVDAEQGCVQPPTTRGYGYPEADEVYNLGFVLEERHEGIEYSYGFGGAYVSIMSGWYGHWGVMGYDDFSHPVHRITTTYNEAGTMESERYELMGTEPLLAERRREFEDGRVVRDVWSDGRGMESILDFEQGEHGIVERTHTVSTTEQIEPVLAARHSWSYEGGEIATHDIEFMSSFFYWPWMDPANFEFPEEPVLDIKNSYVSKRSTGGRAVRLELNGDLIQLIRRDEEGRIVSESNLYNLTTREYDDATGVLVSEWTDWQQDGKVDSARDIELDGEGNVVSRTWMSSPGTEWSERYIFQCD